MAVSVNTTIISNSGEGAAVTSGNMGAQIEITSFQIGSDLITPLATMTGVSTLVYTGTTSQITYSANASTATMTFFITLSETVGNFYVGNIGLFLADGTMFTLTALAVAEYKTATNTAVSPPITGNVRIYAIPVALTNVQNLINVTALFPNYASLPSVATEAQLPAINAAPYNTYLVNALSETNTSSVAVSNGLEWIKLYGILNTSDSAVVIPGLANSMFTEGDAICWNGAALALWDPTSVTSVYVGVVGQNDLVYRNGIFTITNGNPYTAGATYYSGTGVTAGILSTTAAVSADPFLQVGYAMTTNSLVLNAQCSEQLYTFHAAFMAASSLFNTINSVATPYTIQTTDYNKVIQAKGGQINLPITSTISMGFQVLIQNIAPPGTAVTVNPNGASVALATGSTNTLFYLPNALETGSQADFIWLEWAGPTVGSWRVNGASTPLLGAAYVQGSLATPFSASEFFANQPTGYAYKNSTGYYYMDGTNAAVKTPVGGNFYVQNTSGAAVQAIIGYASTAASAVALGQLENGSINPTFNDTYTQALITNAIDGNGTGNIPFNVPITVYGTVACNPAYAGNQAVTLDQFYFNGNYAAFPGGLIMQWGYVGAGTFNFPATFPHGVFVVLATNANAQGGYVDNSFAYPISNSQFYINTKSSATVNTLSNYASYYFAIGY